MLLLDFSSLFIQAAFGLRKRGHIYSKRHLTIAFLSRLFAINKRFKRYGKPYIFADSGRYWRAEAYAGYKKKRAERRSQDGVDWDTLRALRDEIVGEIRQNLPYATLCVDNLEADDLIALACRFYAPRNKEHLIVSSDKDLTQLLRAPNVSQWSAGKRSFLKYDPDAFKAQLLRGDSSDSVPSVYFDGEYLIKSDGRRRLTDSRLKEIDITTLETFRLYFKDDPELERITANYLRNRLLIDLRLVPQKFLPIFRRELKEAQIAAENASARTEGYLSDLNLHAKFLATQSARNDENQREGNRPRRDNRAKQERNADREGERNP
jgi:hypothetical protein